MTTTAPQRTVTVTLVLGMEKYNAGLFVRVKALLAKSVPELDLRIFNDTETETNPDQLDAAIKASDVLFCALIVLNDNAEWLVKRIEQYQPKYVFAFESLGEVMKFNKVGTYKMDKGDGQKSEMPKPVKRIAQLLVGGREEDTFYGYVRLQKISNRVMALLPKNIGGESFKDARTWMTTSSYWTNAGEENVVNMFRFLCRELFGLHPKEKIEDPKEFSSFGFYHPDAKRKDGIDFFNSTKDYLKWEKKTHRDVAGKPKVGILFSRKHILSGLKYPDAVIRVFEKAGLRVYPCYVMGIEMHIAARDWMKEIGTDVLVNLFGFPLVGGPAGSTSNSRGGQTASELAADILADLNGPYIVSQPLFVQGTDDWYEKGVNPMQTMMIYSLPEMDGAICPVVLGAVDNGEYSKGTPKLRTYKNRLYRLSTIVKNWATLKARPNAEKKVALILYDYPPNTGNIGTAALLDVPKSVIKVMKSFQEQGYNVGDFFERINADTNQNGHSVKPEAKFVELFQNSLKADNNPISATVKDYDSWVSEYDRKRVAARWGAAPGDIAPLGNDKILIGGLQFGNIYIGAQPQLWILGDPMRLLFDKENTPHHQYIMFYKWMQNSFKANAVIHFGMHGTAEWMPGLPLGMTQNCWSDNLMGVMPSFYLYPMNNPSEAGIAKRRGYSVITSHAVPPYSRAGLYREFESLRDLVTDYREGRISPELCEAIEQKVQLTNIDKDIVKPANFDDYVFNIYTFLQEMSAKMICGDMHTFGENVSASEQTTLISESLKISRGGKSLADLGAEILNLGSSYAALLLKARTGDAEAVQAKEQIDAFCEGIVQKHIIGNERVKHAVTV